MQVYAKGLAFLINALIYWNLIFSAMAAEKVFIPIRRDSAGGLAAGQAPTVLGNRQDLPTSGSRFIPVERASGRAGVSIAKANRTGPLPTIHNFNLPGRPLFAAATARSNPGAIPVATNPSAAVALPDSSHPKARPRGGKGHVWPIARSAESRVSSGFGWRSDPFDGEVGFHAGIDIAAPAGTPVLATAAATVKAIGTHRRLGRYVMLDYGDGALGIFGHLSRVTVATGRKVESGEQIGAVGRTGRATGPHLDFALEINGRRVDPLPYLALPAELASR